MERNAIWGFKASNLIFLFLLEVHRGTHACIGQERLGEEYVLKAIHGQDVRLWEELVLGEGLSKKFEENSKNLATIVYVHDFDRHIV